MRLSRSTLTYCLIGCFLRYCAYSFFALLTTSCCFFCSPACAIGACVTRKRCFITNDGRAGKEEDEEDASEREELQEVDELLEDVIESCTSSADAQHKNV